MAAVAQFNPIREATDAVFQIMRSGLSPAALEFLDAPTVQVVNRFKKLSLEERPTLFIEFQGASAVGLNEESDMVEWGQKVVEKKGLKGYAFGHAGSGNLHMEILGIPEYKTQWQKVKEAEE